MTTQQKPCLTKLETVAREWLELRLEYIALREKVKGEVHIDDSIRCEKLRLQKSEILDMEYWQGTPCHMKRVPSEGDMLDEDDYCEPCKRRLVLVEKRRELGRKQAGKLRSLYAIFKKGG